MTDKNLFVVTHARHIHMQGDVFKFYSSYVCLLASSLSDLSSRVTLKLKQQAMDETHCYPQLIEDVSWYEHCWKHSG